MLWFGAMTIHVLAYAPRLARLITAGGRGRTAADGRGAATRVQGSMARWLLLAAALGVGLILAVLTIHLAGSWSGGGTAAAIGPVA